MPTRNSFENVYTTISSPLTKFIAKKLGSDPEALDEIFARTICAAWKGWGTFRNKSGYLTWFCAIAIKKIADYYREQVHTNSVMISPFLESMAFELQDNDYSPEEITILHEVRASIRECVKLIPPEKRQLIYLRFWGNLTIKEIAKAMNAGERSVEGKLYRAKRLLKQVLESNHPDLASQYLKSK